MREGLAAWCCCAALLAGAAAWAGPVSQAGSGAAGVLLLAQEPNVDLLGTSVTVDVEGDRARVTVGWVLSSKTARAVEAMVGAGVVMTQRDGTGPIPAPWEDVALTWDGQPLPSTLLEEFPARAELRPGDDVTTPARGQWIRARLQLKGGKTHVLQVRFTRVVTHDDWRLGDGGVARSAGEVRVRPRPLGFKGKAAGVWNLEVHGPPGITVTPAPARGDVRDLLNVEDVVVGVPAGARGPARPTP